VIAPGRLSITAAGVGRLDELRPLWLVLHEHHRRVSVLPLLADDEASWARRQRRYRRWLEADEAFVLIAEVPGRGLVGYAVVRLEEEPDDTWPVDATSAELYSLSVAPAVRGRGIGTALLDAVDAELERRGIHALAVAVMAGNVAARRLYERRGLVAGETYLYRFGKATRSQAEQ
jgi:ribosomal protein S18 acetylase RimI-like enzyme